MSTVLPVLMLWYASPSSNSIQCGLRTVARCHKTIITTGNIRAVHPLTALIPTLPNTIILIPMDIAGHLIHRNHLASLLIPRVKRERRFSAWTRRTQTAVQPAETVFATRPFGECELAGATVVGGLADVAAVLLVVEPLACVGAGVGLAVDVLDCDAG